MTGIPVWEAWIASVSGTPALILGVFVLLAASAFFSGSETALVSASRARLTALADEGRRDAREALLLLRDTPRTIASILVGNNISNVAASSIVTLLALRVVSEERAPLVATLVLTPIVLFVGEILPKAFFRVRPTRKLRAIAGALRLFERVFAPVVLITSAATKALLWLLRIPPAERRPVFRRKDLENVLLFGVSPAAAHEEGPDETALRMAAKALNLRKRTVREIMVALPEDRTCGAGATVADAIERFRTRSGRFVASLDREGHVAGFVFARKLLGEPPGAPLDRFAQSAYLLDLDDTVDDVIQGFRRHQQSIGLARGREGETLGIVTLDGLFAQVVGELRLISTPHPRVPQRPQRED